MGRNNVKDTISFKKLKKKYIISQMVVVLNLNYKVINSRFH